MVTILLNPIRDVLISFENCMKILIITEKKSVSWRSLQKSLRTHCIVKDCTQHCTSVFSALSVDHATLKAKVETLKRMVTRQQSASNSHEHSVEFTSRSIRDNVLFHNIPESRKQSVLYMQSTRRQVLLWTCNLKKSTELASAILTQSRWYRVTSLPSKVAYIQTHPHSSLHSHNLTPKLLSSDFRHF